MDGTRMFKVVMTLGAIFLLSGSVFTGSNSAWTELTLHLERGPNLPGPQTATIERYVTAANRSLTDAEGSVGCLVTGGAWYQCLQSDDDNGSYVMWGQTYAFISFNMTNLPALAQIIVGVTLVYTCSATAGATARASTVNPLTESSPGLHLGGPPSEKAIVCPNYPLWGRATIHLPQSMVDQWNWSNIDTNWNVEMGLVFGGLAAGKRVYLSFFEALVTYIPASNCGTGNFWVDLTCSIAAGVNAIVQALGVFWAYITFIGTAVVIFFGGFFVSLAYLFAIPGCPPIVQALIDIPLIAILAWVVVQIISVIVGIVGGVVNKA